MQQMLSQLQLLSLDLPGERASYPLHAMAPNGPVSPQQVDLASCLALSQAIEDTLMADKPDPNIIVHLPLPLFGTVDSTDDWDLVDAAARMAGRSTDPTVLDDPKRGTRLPTFASFPDSTDSPVQKHGIKPTFEALVGPGNHHAAAPFKGRANAEAVPIAFGGAQEQPRAFSIPVSQYGKTAPPLRAFGPVGTVFAPPNNTHHRVTTPEPPAELEARATKIIEEYLSDPTINPYRGSVPLERIQNIFRGKHADLYQQVVGSKHSAWKKYIARNSDIFEQFSKEEGKWRMRLRKHNDWLRGDELEEAARLAWETHFTTILASYLETKDNLTSSLDAFMAAYPGLTQGTAEDEQPSYDLPHRGDLVRFIRRSSRFAYDQASFLISFRGAADPLQDGPASDAQQQVHGYAPTMKEDGALSFGRAAGFGATDGPPPPPSPERMGTPYYVPTLSAFFQPAFYGPTPAYMMGAYLPATPVYSAEGGPAPSAELEQKVTQLIASFLLDKAINPYQGSVPVERVQNLFRSRHAELYEQVVGSKHSAWKRFVERNHDIFNIFSMEEGKWRMRLLCHQDWESGDRRERAAQDASETYFTGVLSEHLGGCAEGSSTLDAFMAAYPALSHSRTTGDDGAEPYPLPHRGDLVRFLRRSAVFSYDQSSFLIAFKKTKELPANAEGRKPSPKARILGQTKLNPNAPCFCPKASAPIEG